MPSKRSSKKISPKRQKAIKKKPAVRKTLKTKPAKKREIKKPIARRGLRKAASPHFRVILEHFIKHEGNPIIEPREGNTWESKATLNPAALFLGSEVHLLYRAIGDNDMSVLGYAMSRDGLSIDERLDNPAFVPRHKTDTKKEGETPPMIYSSGGGWNGGCEDPRLTEIEGRVYLIYTAFDGWGSLRMALSSISSKDFRNKKWNWKKSSLMSPEGEIHKNWVLFPEKINGKFAILHSIAPEILVDYFDSLDDFDGKKKVIRGSVRKMEVTDKARWESLVRGAGPPPIKTKDGWLVLYHAIDRRSPDQYKLGAMVLDLSDPTKVLYRSSQPIMEPNEYYENHGFKGGIIYSCGAGVIGEQLFVYYGGADTVVCVATANLENFLSDLKKTGKPALHAVAMKRSDA